ncbi:MAG: hypothetical protein RR506_06050, partial [Akkermansia sp.]
MNIKLMIRSLAFSAAGCLVLSSCYDPNWDVGVGASYNSGGYGGSSYGGNYYDTTGYPVFGYQGGRPVYAYDTYGRPVYSINLIYRNYYIPSWRPAHYYHGHYHRPHYVRPCHRPPHGCHGSLQRPPHHPSRPDYRPDHR